MSWDVTASHSLFVTSPDTSKGTTLSPCNLCMNMPVILNRLQHDNRRLKCLPQSSLPHKQTDPSKRAEGIKGSQYIPSTDFFIVFKVMETTVVAWITPKAIPHDKKHKWLCGIRCTCLPCTPNTMQTTCLKTVKLRKKHRGCNNQKVPDNWHSVCYLSGPQHINFCLQMRKLSFGSCCPWRSVSYPQWGLGKREDTCLYHQRSFYPFAVNWGADSHQHHGCWAMNYYMNYMNWIMVLHTLVWCQTGETVLPNLSVWVTLHL